MVYRGRDGEKENGEEGKRGGSLRMPPNRSFHHNLCLCSRRYPFAIVQNTVYPQGCRCCRFIWKPIIKWGQACCEDSCC
ncbi:hypothetical protein NMG60_11007356 [Bertholletia excelsa]